nr:redox-regulated ATPase YchF [Spirochaeta sp.]
METGIIGLPLSGKTTIFNALTGQDAQVSGYTGGKKRVNLAEVEVPDPRLEELNKIFKPKKSRQAVVLIKDLQVDFTPQGGLAASVLGELRNCEAIIIILRAFLDESVPHTLEEINPLQDLHTILDSLVFSDYEIAEKRLERLIKEGKKKSREYLILHKLSEKFSTGGYTGSDFLNPDEEKLVSGFGFLTLKPLILVANSGENQVGIEPLEKEVESLKLALFTISGQLEMEIARLTDEDQRDFLAEMGLEEPAKNRFLRQLYSTLNLISFLTASEKEVRAWSLIR